MDPTIHLYHAISYMYPYSCSRVCVYAYIYIYVYIGIYVYVRNLLVASRGKGKWVTKTIRKDHIATIMRIAKVNPKP